MRRRRRIALVLLASLCALGVALEAWLVLTPTEDMRSGSRAFEIPAHRGALEVARILQEAGVIRSRSGFLVLTLMRGSIRTLKAGEYEAPRDANTRTVLGMLETGQVRQHAVVFREGSTVAELARQLAAEGLANADEVVRASREARLLRMVGVPTDSVEGYLYPDTYQLVKGMTAEEILTRMVGRMREQVSGDILSQARARELNLHQLLTLASIIEKEAVERSEMPLISAVFWNRLGLEMPLQADPTVQYAVGKERQRLTHEDLAVESPFNTYRRTGLPPGPIASPSLAAIRAAANPAPVSYLYFVKSDERHHQFSVTLTDHNAAVAKYRVVRAR
jgi:peptidoglycan lytic transglycosylase G